MGPFAIYGIGVCLFFICRIAEGQATDSDALKQRIQLEKLGKSAAEATEPPDSEKAAVAIRLLDSPDEKVRAEAVGKLRLLSRRVDRSGGQRVQRGEAFAPKVPGLLSELIKAAHDPEQRVRAVAAYALADTQEPLATATLRELLDDPESRVRLSAADRKSVV